MHGIIATSTIETLMAIADGRQSRQHEELTVEAFARLYAVAIHRDGVWSVHRYQ